MKKTLRGKRYIRSRNSVLIGRIDKSIRKQQRLIDGLSIQINISSIFISQLKELSAAIKGIASSYAASYLSDPSNWALASDYNFVSPQQKVKEFIEKADTPNDKQTVYYNQDWQMITPND